MELPNNGNVLTRQGYEEMQRELHEIMKVKRPAVVERIKEALQLGDLSENFDYHDAKHQQGLLEARLQQLKSILDNATIIDCASEDGCVGVGSTVVIRDVEEGFEEEYMIVGPPEANPSDGKISFESCMGSTLMGCKAGDKIAVQTPAGEFQYEVVSIK